jgi:hypothetical protein
MRTTRQIGQPLQTYRVVSLSPGSDRLARDPKPFGDLHDRRTAANFGHRPQTHLDRHTHRDGGIRFTLLSGRHVINIAAVGDPSGMSR